MSSKPPWSSCVQSIFSRCCCRLKLVPNAKFYFPADLSVFYFVSSLYKSRQREYYLCIATLCFIPDTIDPKTTRRSYSICSKRCEYSVRRRASPSWIYYEVKRQWRERASTYFLLSIVHLVVFCRRSRSLNWARGGECDNKVWAGHPSFLRCHWCTSGPESSPPSFGFLGSLGQFRVTFVGLALLWERIHKLISKLLRD